MHGLVFFAAALLAQAAPDGPGLAPYMLRLKGEPEFRHVLVDPSQTGNISFQVLIDEPWAGEHWVRVQLINVEELEPEESALRARWIRNGWRAHGGVEFTTRSKEQVWILAEDEAWAAKSQALARAAYASEEPSAERVAPPDEQHASGPGFLRLWAPHTAVLAGALALAAGVYFALLRPRAHWSALDSGNRAPRRR